MATRTKQQSRKEQRLGTALALPPLSLSLSPLHFIVERDFSLSLRKGQQLSPYHLFPLLASLILQTKSSIHHPLIENVEKEKPLRSHLLFD